MEKGRDRGLHRLNDLCPIEKTIMCEVIAMAETIIGNVNHLSKPATSDYSCEPLIFYQRIAQAA